MSHRKKNVGIYGSIEDEAMKRTFDGMLRYMEEVGGVVARGFQGPEGISESQFSPPWRGKCDGIVICTGKESDMSDSDMANWVIQGGVPAVKAGRDWDDPRIPRYFVDQRQLGEIAANHLIECGCASFLYFGNSISTANTDRYAALCAALAEHGKSAAEWNISYHTRQQGPRRRIIKIDAELLKLLRTLPKPLGILLLNDDQGPLIYAHCETLKLDIPASIKIVGTRDFPIARKMKPMLTSIRTPVETIGYLAMKALDELLQGKKVSEESSSVGGMTLAVRGSTTQKPQVGEFVRYALKYIEIHACSGMSVDEIAESTGVPRRTLERRFREFLGRSPGEEIGRVRLERAKLLIEKHDLPIGRIAALIAFEELAAFTKFFTKQTGVSPSTYRRRKRQGNDCV